jgi:hypothetical protein
MRGDFTRIPASGPRHYLGILHQQGRVWLDSDWNEAVLSRVEDQRRLTADLLGEAVAPAAAPGFQVRPFDNPARQLDFLLGAGRFFVHGLECQLGFDTPYSAQPDFPTAPLPTLPANNALRAVVYLDVWQRLITALEDPALLEIALGGPDTTVRLKTVAQAKLLPLTDDTLTGATVATVLPQPGQGTLRTLQPASVTPGNPCRLPDPTNYSGPENHLYRVEIHTPGDVLNPVPANPPPPTRLFRSKLAANAAPRLLVLQDNLGAAQTAVLQAAGVANLVDDDGQAETAAIAGIALVSGQTQLTLASDLQGTFTTAKNATLIGGVARFKWSRDNAAFAVGVTAVSADGQTLHLTALGRDDATALRELDLVEVSDDASELGSGAGFLTTVAASPDPDALVVTLAVPLPPNTFDPARHMTLRRWDGVGWAGAAYSDTGTPDMNLGDGVHLQFGGSDLRRGDYWVFATRTADGSVEPLADAPPYGPRHYFVPLAIVRWSTQTWFPIDSITGVVNLSDRPDAPLKPLLDRLTQLKQSGTTMLDAPRVLALARGLGVSSATVQTIGVNLGSLGTTQGQSGPSLAVEEDCRNIVAPPGAPGVRIVDVKAVKTGLSLLNDSDVSVDDLISGVNVVCSETVDPASLTEVLGGTAVSPKPVFQFSVTVPFPFPGADATVWGTAAIGSVELALGSTLSLGSDGKTLQWQPVPAVVTWLQQLLFLKAAPGASRVLAHLTIRGNFLWSGHDPDRRLAGGEVGVPRAIGGRTGLRLPSGLPARSGDFSMWIWLLKSSVAAIPAILSLSVNNPQTTGGTTGTTGSIKLTIPAPNDIVVTLKATVGTTATTVVTFANNGTSVTILKGTDNSTFPITTQPVTSDTVVTITATLPVTNPPSTAGTMTTTLTVLHPTLSGFTINPARVSGGVATTGTISFTGPVPAAGVSVSAASDNAAATVGSVTPATAVPAQQYTVKLNTTVVRAIAQAQVTASVSIPGASYTASSAPQPLTIQGGLFSVALAAKSIFVNQSTTVNIVLSCTAFDDLVINLSASNPGVSLSATTLTIEAGQPGASVTVTGIAPAANVTITASQAGLPVQSDTLDVVNKPKETKESKDGKDTKEGKDGRKDGKDGKEGKEGPAEKIHKDRELQILMEPPARPDLVEFGLFPPHEGDLAAMVRLLARRLDEMEERVSTSRAFIRPEERPAVGVKAFDDSRGDPADPEADTDAETDPEGGEEGRA